MSFILNLIRTWNFRKSIFSHSLDSLVVSLPSFLDKSDQNKLKDGILNLSSCLNSLVKRLSGKFWRYFWNCKFFLQWDYLKILNSVYENDKREEPESLEILASIVRIVNTNTKSMFILASAQNFRLGRMIQSLILMQQKPEYIKRATMRRYLVRIRLLKLIVKSSAF